MSQSVKEFVRQSGVDVRKSPDYNSNNNFARELEMEMERAERANAAERMARREAIVRGQQFFREPTRPEIQRRRPAPLENEFADVNINKLVNNALREPRKRQGGQKRNSPFIPQQGGQKRSSPFIPQQGGQKRVKPVLAWQGS